MIVDGAVNSCTLPTGTYSATGADLPVILVQNSAAVTGSAVTVDLAATGTTGARAETGGTLGLTGSTISTIAVNTANSNGQAGLLASGPNSRIDFSSGSILLEPATGTGAAVTANNLLAGRAEAGGTITLTDATVRVRGALAGQSNNGLLVTGPGSTLTITRGSVTTQSTNSTVVRAELGGTVTLDGTTVGTVQSTSGLRGLVASGTGSRIGMTDGSTIAGLGTAVANDMLAVLAEAGGAVTLNNTAVATQSAANGSRNHALFATGPGSSITATGGTVNTASVASFGARAEDGATITLRGGIAVTTTGAASSATGTPPSTGSHALTATGSASRIFADGTTVSTSGLLANGARAEDGATVTIANSSFSITGGNGNELFGHGGAVALTGGQIALDTVTITTTSTRADGLHASGAGSRIVGDAVTVSTSWSQGNAAANAVDVRDGATVALTDSSLTSVITAVTLGTTNDTAGATFTATNTAILSTGPTAAGLRAVQGASATLTGGTLTTLGLNSPGLITNGGRIEANNVAVTTEGDGRSYGVYSNGNSLVTLNGGSVVTRGEPELPFTPSARRPHGVVADNPGGILISIGTAITTAGVEGFGVTADDGGIITLSGNRVTTTGEAALGLYAGIDQAGPQFLVGITGTDVVVSTAGARAYGAYVSRTFFEGTATVSLLRGSIATSGDHAMGIRAIGGGTLTADGTTVQTQGTGAHGIIARYFVTAVVPDPRHEPTSATLTGVGIATTGTQAHGAVVENGARLTGSNVTINASGANAMGLYAIGEVGPASSASFTASRLINAIGPTIGIAGAADVTLIDTVVGNPMGTPGAEAGNFQWLHVGTIDGFPLLQALADPIAGDLNVPEEPSAPEEPIPEPFQALAISPLAASPLATSGIANVTMSGSHVTGSAITLPGSISNVAMESGSTWDLTGDSNLTRLANNLSQILYSAPIGDPARLASYKTLTTVDYTGQSGMIGLNTFLGRDGSPSDLLVIDGGIASGSTRLRIANTAGAGARTPGNGILVVDAIGGGTTVPGAFALAGPVIAGPYEYTLHRASVDASAPEDWFLRNTLEPTPTPTPTPTPPPVPHYRQEASVYAAAPALMGIYGRLILDTLHERVGEEEQLRGNLPRAGSSELAKAMWGRILYRDGRSDGDPLGIYGDSREGPSYDSDMIAFQMGLDIYRHQAVDADGKEGARDHVGIMGTYGGIDADVDHNLLAQRFRAGRIRMENWSLGAFWTHFTPKGAYLDLVGQATFYDIKLQSTRLPEIGTDGFGIALSAEGGYPLRLGENWLLEPQAQLVYQTLSIDDFTDPGARVRFRDLDSLAGRIGLRFANAKGEAIGDTQGWLRGNIWHEFLGNPRTEFSSADGFIPFRADPAATWWQVGLGGSVLIDSRVTLYGQGNYEAAFDGDSHAWSLKAGMRFSF